MNLKSAKIFYLIPFLTIIFTACNKIHEPEKIISVRLQSEWKFKNRKSDKWYAAEVPGTVHTDLYNNSLIPDPFYGQNEEKLQWIENEDWEYETEFDVSDNILNKKHIELVFKGLDTYAEVRLNDSLIINADNMFRTWRAGCSGILKKHNNTIHILFRSPVKENIPKFKSLPYQLPAGNDRGKYKVSVFARKSPYHFGWDWGPRFVTSGIWRPIQIEAWESARITDFQIYQISVSDKRAELKAGIEVISDKGGEFVLKLLNGNKTIVKRTVFLKQGRNVLSEIFKIKNPKLWWTNGLGEPHLYKFSVVLLQKGSIIDKKSTGFGIRTVEIVQKPDSAGKSFYFKINGVPVFMKGANYIPQDSFLPRVTKKRYEKLISSAKTVNMNMLRVWGGGIYENDIFYDLCDENGILVWQDFMFSCSMYPGDEKFLSNVKKEAEENVKRLRKHPSIALWCGNNEMQVAWERWGYQKAFGYSKSDSAKIYNDYLKIFHGILPDVVNSLDPGRFYWPSSPNSAPSGWYEEARSGDFHYWGVWWGKEPFSEYEKYVGRFVSEYGFQSMPSYYTIRSFADSSSCCLVSPVLKSHNKHPVGFETIDQYMKRDFKVPENFRDYITASQILQAQGMKTAIEAHRRAMPYCMGSLYWQLDDCWPVVSWSGIDYFGRWKAFHYYLKKLYAPVLVSPVLKNGKLDVYLVSDLPEDKNITLKMELMDFFGKVLWEEKKKVPMQANTSRVIFSQNITSVISQYDKREIFLHCRVLDKKNVLAENDLFFVKPKDLKLLKPEIEYKFFNKSGKFYVELRSGTFTKCVFLDYPDDTGVFSDNYFSMIPGEKKTIQVKIENADAEFGKRIRIKTYPY